MLIVIHGEDTANSRKFLQQEKDRLKDALDLEGDKIDLTTLKQIAEGGGLFGEEKNLFIEHFVAKRKKGGDYKLILEYIQEISKENNVFLWEGKELEKSVITSLKAQEKIFKLPQVLFSFTDSLRPGNQKNILTNFHKAIDQLEEEMVFSMLIRQFRLMLAVSGESGENIDDLKRVAWQIGKLRQQASAFKKGELLRLYAKLFDIETRQKTGTLTAPLSTEIDFFLLEI